MEQILDNKLKYISIMILSLSLIISAQPKPNDIFNLLDLNYPGLEEVKEAVGKNEFDDAQKKLLIYFQNRNNRKSEIGEKKFTADINEADMNSKNIFEIKTIKYDFGKNIDWTKVHKDKEWQFSFGRMKWFENYVAAYMETNDDKYVNAWMEQFKSWTQLNDPGYPRTIDTGRRMENLTESYWMFVQVLKAESVTPEFNALILTSMYQQAEYQYNPDNWRRYSNWGTFENSGFAIFTVLFPEFKRNNNWMKELFFRMRTQLKNSFFEDGMHVETSPAYHSHELEVWFNFIKLIEKNEIDDPWSPQVKYATYEELIVPKAIALMDMYKPTGFIPQVSDTDWRDERDLFEEIGEYFNVPELEYFASDGKKGLAPKYRSISYPKGGYAILRSGWGDEKLKFNDELYLLFDFGNNKPWHAHYDIFNIVATAYGNDLLIDPGRYTYNDGEEREAFKSTAYHNTVEVDSKNQMKYYKAPVIKNYFFENYDYLQGVQKSYEGVEHKRSIFFAGKEYWIVIDRLNSELDHTYKQNWHLTHESLNKVEVDENNVVTTPHMLMYFPEDSNVSVRQSFQSREYRKKLEIPVVQNMIENNNKALLPIIIYPFEKNEPKFSVKSIVGNDDEQFLLTVKGDKFSDLFVENIAEDFKLENISTDAEVIYFRKNNDNEITKLAIINGSYLNISNENIVRTDGDKINLEYLNGNINITTQCLRKLKLRFDQKISLFLNGNALDTKYIDGYIIYE